MKKNEREAHSQREERKQEKVERKKSEKARKRDKREKKKNYYIFCVYIYTLKFCVKIYF